MKNHLKFMGLLIASVLLTACIEVEDDSNDDVVDALQEQNEILQDQSEQTANPVTLYGSIIDLATDEAVSEATLRIKVGPTWREPVTFQGVEFEIPDLPNNSEFELVISSPSGEFIDRTLFGGTRFGASGSEVYQDMGRLGVSSGIERSFAVLNAETNQPVEGLVFKGYSHIGDGTNYRQYAHTSSYDAGTGLYSITLPEYIGVSLRATLDFNDDGILEYFPESPQFRSGNDLYLTANTLNDLQTLYLVDSIVYQDIELRVSVIDSSAESISDLELTIDDHINNLVIGTFDTETQQYIFNVKFDSSIRIMAPAFSIGDINYSSSSINISRRTDNSYSIYHSNAQNYVSYIVFGEPSVLDLALQPIETSPTFALEMVAKSDTVNPVDESFKIFYSSPIGLLPDSAKIIQEDVITIVKGNDDPNDLVLPGTTLITEEDVSVNVNTLLSLNDTLLTIAPATPLAPGFNYRYEVGNIVEQSSGVEADIHNDYISYSVKTDAAFNINELVLDNNNYTTNGTTIVTQNTAGDAASPTNNDRWVYLFLPPSVVNLQSFVLGKQVVVKDGTAENSIRTFEIVVDGQLRYQNESLVVSLAENETVNESIYRSIRPGTAVAEGLWYFVTVGEYMSDNLNTSANEITFEYVYETLEGDVHNGTITLPVL